MALDDLMTTALMENVREAFGQAVRRLLDGRGLSLRQARTRTGIDIDTLSRMRAGEVVRMDKIIQFARGFGLNPSDWLELAGYERLDQVGEGGGVSEERGPLSNRDRLAAWVLEMAEKYPHSHSLQVALRAGLEKLHEQPAEVLEHDLGVWEAVLREEEENEEGRG